MKIDSLVDWMDLLSSCLYQIGEDQEFASDWFPTCWPYLALEAIRAKKDLTNSAKIKMFADYGLDFLKEASVTPSDVSVKPDGHDRTLDEIAYTWQTSQMLKKFKYGQLGRDDMYAAFVGFQTRDSACANHIPDGIRQRMRELLVLALPPIDDSSINGKFGPGAVAERYDQLERWDLLPDFSFDYRSMQLTRQGSWSKVRPARLCAVPKDCSKFRLITIEPVENTWGQQYTRGVLLEMMKSGVLRHTPTSLEESLHPAKNGNIYEDRYLGYSAADSQRARAIEGSRTGKTATLDLSDASDTISWAAVQSVFPASVVALLERFRTPQYYARTPRGAVARDMTMYAGMGNATTFPVETLFFWALITALSEEVGDRTAVSVFGDDIICGTRAANNKFFQDRLSECGLKLNLAKCGTSDGPGFRESCGIVAVKGYILPELIRIPGYKPDENPGDELSLCAMINRVFDQSGYESKRDDRYAMEAWNIDPSGKQDLSDFDPSKTIVYNRVYHSLKRYAPKGCKTFYACVELYPVIESRLLAAFFGSLWEKLAAMQTDRWSDPSEAKMAGFTLALSPVRADCSGLWIYYPSWYNEDRCGVEQFIVRLRWNPELQRTEARILTEVACKVTKQRGDLRLCEALGVVAGLLSTKLKQQDKASLKTTTLISAPSRDTRFKFRWVPVR